MNFSELVEHYINQLGCTAKELAEASNLSYTAISRYRNGGREPSSENNFIHNLAHGISLIASKKSIYNLEEELVLNTLLTSLNQNEINYEQFLKKYNALLSALDIPVKTLSAELNYDSSYLYRIKSGQRRPNSINQFASSICLYVTKHFTNLNDKKKVAELINCSVCDIKKESAYLSLLFSWIQTGEFEDFTDSMRDFLQKLDEFDLEEYIRVIHFNELKVPSLPFQFTTTKTYYGVEEMKQGELDFFKSTVLSKSMEPIFMCSDMPLADMAEDHDFNKKWMFAIAMSLKKGLHLNIIHNINRPFREMLLGLEAWIPIYMTGQVSTYHLANYSDKIYHHLNYVSGYAALEGECIHGNHKNGRYILTTRKEDVAYFKLKAKQLISKAEPLLEIYDLDSKQEFSDFSIKDSNYVAPRHSFLSAPPLYTMSETLLTNILERENIDPIETEQIKHYYHLRVEQMKTILSHSTVLDELLIPSVTDFNKHPIVLPLAGAFLNREIPYIYEDFLEHIKQTKDYEAQANNYTFNILEQHAFRNIQIQVVQDKYVVISKIKSPVIHFVIKHPKLVHALQNFSVLVME